MIIKKEKIKEIENRIKEIDKELIKPETIKDYKKYKELGKERNQLHEILELYEKYKKLAKEYEDTMKIMEEDESMRELAEEELERISNEKERLERELKNRLIKRDPDDSKNVIMEIRAGAGGEEAAIFAADLFRMYQKFCEKKGWKIEILNTHRSDLNGFKEIIFYVKGENVYSILKYERGVHRVQRVPVTESSGRIHTSTATVAVLPEMEEGEIKIDPRDLKIETFRASGPGGQYVNTTDSAVRITHLPTGIVVSCQDQRSQYQNRIKAMQILRARLYEKQKQEQQEKLAKERKSQIGSGERSEKIRTYNFPQNRVTDHRINLTLYNLDRILDGELDEIIENLMLADEKNEVTTKT